MPVQLGVPSTKLNILLTSFYFFLLFSNEGSPQSRSMAPRPPGYPLELAGPLVDLQFSSLSEATHETPGVSFQSSGSESLYACCTMISIILKGPTNLRCSFAGAPFIFKLRVYSSTKSPTL